MRLAWRGIAAIASLVVVTPVVAQTNAPPAIVAAQLADGAVDPDATDWFQGAFVDATPMQKAEWQKVLAWLAQCHANGLSVIRRELGDLGIADPQLEGQVAGDITCQSAKTLSPHPFRQSTQAEFRAIDAQARRIFITYRHGAKIGFESAPFDPAWANEEARILMRATVHDQVYRRGYDWPEDMLPPGPNLKTTLMRRLGHAMVVTDMNNTEMLKAHVAKNGWPTINRVGALASGKAWLLVQHADHDPAFQLRALRLMEPLAAQGEVSEANYAYLYDRVMLKITGTQRYATQVTCHDGKRVPRPIETGIDADAERRKMKLDPLADYIAGMDREFSPCPA